MTSKAQVEITASDKTRTAFASVERNLAGMRAAAISTTASLAGIGTALGVGVFASAIRSSIDAADSLNDLSQRTGIAISSLGGLEIAAKQSGTSLEGVANGVRNLSIFMVEAAEGNKQNAATLKALGVTAKDPEQALIQLANAFSKMEDGPKKTKLAYDILKRSGQELIPILNNGGDALQKILDLYKQLNPNIEKLAKFSDQFNDQMVALNASTTSLANTAAVNLLPVLNSILKTMVDTTRESGLLAGAMAGVKGVFSNIFSDSGSSREQQIANRLAAIGKSMDGILARRKQWFASSDFAERDLQALNKEAIALQKELALIQQTAAAKDDAKNKGGDIDLPNTEAADKARSAAEAAARANRQAIISAEERLQSAQKLSNVLQTTFDIEQGKYKGLSAATKQRLLEIAAEIDATAAADASKKDQEAIAKQATDDGIARFKALQEAGARVYESTRTDAEKYGDEVVRLNDLLAQGAISQETYNKAVIGAQDAYQKAADKAKESMDDMSQFAIQAARNQQTAFAQFLFDPFKDGVKGMASGFLNAIRQMAANAAAAHIFDSLLGNGKKDSGLLGGLFSSAVGSLFGGTKKFASGGMHSGGLRLVGENGPELEMTGPSRIFNADQTKSMLNGGGDSITLNLTIQTGVAQTVRAEIMSMVPAIKKEVIAGVINAKGRGLYNGALSS